MYTRRAKRESFAGIAAKGCLAALAVITLSAASLFVTIIAILGALRLFGIL